MFLDFLIEKFRERADQDALVWNDEPYTYGVILNRYCSFLQKVKNTAAFGTVIGLEADFSPDSVGLMLALIETGYIVVPLTRTAQNKDELLRTAGVETLFSLDEQDKLVCSSVGFRTNHELFAVLKERQHPGLILFSSGSTGKVKATLHDMVLILKKFHSVSKGKRMLVFLLFDHIGGLNTVFYVLAGGGCMVTVLDRSPDAVLKAVERHKVEVLPTTPTFMNLILLSDAYHNYDLSSLEVISYGTEVMPERTLKRFREIFPSVKLLQTYGLSEIGIMKTRSKSSDSTWVHVGGEGFETRIVDQMLEIKAESAMLGYLNAPSPFTPDGWFKTGDAVEIDGDFIKILGRHSEMINVGGEKVYPAEVENTILQMEGVQDAVVKGEPNPIVGSIVVLTVKLKEPETLAAFRARMRAFCQGRLALYKIPQKVLIAAQFTHSNRFKKMRPC